VGAEPTCNRCRIEPLSGEEAEQLSDVLLGLGVFFLVGRRAQGGLLGGALDQSLSHPLSSSARLFSGLAVHGPLNPSKAQALPPRITPTLKSRLIENPNP
jgi:hypothetical protein